MHLRYYSAYDSCKHINVHFTLIATCSELFPIKLTVRTLQLAENFSDRQTTRLPQNSVSNVCYT